MNTSVLALGPLRDFHEAGVVDIADVHVACSLLRITRASVQDQPEVALAAALCVRALRAGSVCLELAADPTLWLPEAHDAPHLVWPQPQAWHDTLSTNPLVAVGEHGPHDRPLRLVDGRLYLQRYWGDENSVRKALAARGRLARVSDTAHLATHLHRLFPAPRPDRQRLAAATAAVRQVSIIAGGPGTGKTTTVAAVLTLLQRSSARTLRIALAAPTGKAAARLQEAVSQALAQMDEADRQAVGAPSASTVHRMLGWRPGSSGRFHHDHANPLPFDVVVLDETSMVSLPLMARLVEALRTDARLILVGDPDQLASIDAGAVLGDLVAAAGEAHDDVREALLGLCPNEAEAVDRAAATGVVVLDRNYRFGGAIGALAAAIQSGDADLVMQALRAGDAVEFLEPGNDIAMAAIRHDVVEQTRGMVAAAQQGQADDALMSLENHRILCAHRDGPYGVSHWDDLVEAWTAHLVHREGPTDAWYVGRPLLVTANDYTTDLYNGDTGVVIATDGGRTAVFARGGGHLHLPVARLDTVHTLRAMTIHRGQGSQFDAVTVILPPAESPLLTRELLYTAVTRARNRIRVVGTEAAVRAAIQRQVRRASGLRV